MVHSVYTAFEDSDTLYGVDKLSLPLKPLPQGLGQGNGTAPAMWSIVSTPIINCPREAGHEAFFKCRISGDSIF